MIKRVFSIVLTVISLFTLVLPVSAQAENGVTEPEYYAAQISVNNKDAWGVITSENGTIKHGRVRQ